MTALSQNSFLSQSKDALNFIKNYAKGKLFGIIINYKLIIILIRFSVIILLLLLHHEKDTLMLCHYYCLKELL